MHTRDGPELTGKGSMKRGVFAEKNVS